MTFGIIGGYLSVSSYVFLDPILSDFMDAEYGIKEEVVGLIFLGQGAGYLLFCLTYPYFIEYMPRRLVIHTMGIISAVAILLYGPSYLLGLRASLHVTVTGLVMGGFFNGGYQVPLTSEVIKNGEDFVGFNNKQFNDLFSGLENTALALGEVIGPLIGNFLFRRYGFRTTCDVMAAVNLLFFVTYYVFCDLLFTKPSNQLKKE